MDRHDPSLWSINDVRQWAESTFEFGSAFAKSLVENDVDGQVLLDFINDETLKTDIGVQSLGRRVKIMTKIHELQTPSRVEDYSVSQRFSKPPQSNISLFRFNTPLERRTSDFHRFSNSLSDLSMSPFTPQSSRDVPLTYPLEFKLHTAASGQLVLESVAGTPNSLISRFKAEASMMSTPDIPDTPTIPRTIESCHHETMGSPMSVEGDQLDGEIFSNSMEDVHHQPDREISRKHPIDDLEASPSIIPKRRKTTLVYFGSKEMRAADVMFPPEGDPTGDDQDDIIVFYPSHPTGERLYVQRLMRKLFINPDITSFPHNNLYRTVWKLHPVNLIKKHEQYMALVFDTTPENCKIFKAAIDVLSIPSEPLRRPRISKDAIVRFNLDDSHDPFDAGGDWNYLSKWNYMTNDTLLPLFLNSDSEDAEYDDSTIREMELEEQQKNGIQDIVKPLSIQVIRETIEKELEKFKDLWIEKELPRLEDKAHRIYRKRQTQGTRNLTASKYKKELKNVMARIDGYKIEYESVEWKSVEELKRICVNMQESVNRIQVLEWSIKLLEGRPPPKLVVEETGEDEEVEDIEDVEERLVDDEAVVTEAEDADGEDDDDEEEDDDDDEDDDVEEDEDHEMDGFIIGDDEVEFEMPDGLVMGDEASMVEDKDDEDEDLEVTASQRANRGKKNKLKVIIGDDEDDIVEVDPAGESHNIPDVVPDDESADISEGVDDPVDPEPLEGSPHAEPVDPKPINARANNQSDKEASSLPTPPEDAVKVEGVKLKSEPKLSLPPPSDAPDTPNITGYDSDIPMFFGDDEISEFCQWTEASTDTAKIYLLKADGDTNRAIMSYLEDKENDCVLQPSKPRKSKLQAKRGGSRREVINLDDDGDYGNAPPLSEIFVPKNTVFAKVMPRDNTLETVRLLVAGIRLADLHATIKEVAERVYNEDLDPLTTFIDCETLENCAAYWKIYLAYTQHLFGRAKYNLSAHNLESIQSAASFKVFHKILVTYLDVQPPQPLTPSKRRVLTRGTSVGSDRELSPLRRQDDTPADRKGKKKHKSKHLSTKKIAKPINKSSEQVSQKKELKRIADREKDQKKKGNYMATAEDGSILVNIGKKISEATISLHPQLAATMKDHQVEGLRFIWTQVIMITKGVGCLLAHTMGLGKTLQIIAFLITLSLVPSDVKMDMPERLRKEDRRYLVICPPSIVVNWKNEFKRWTPEDCKDTLGQIYAVNEISLSDRMTTIRRWYHNGGVLLIGYSQFRALLSPKKKTEQAKKSLENWLLNGPDLVVADEAHEIKNEKSRITELLNRIGTGSRIATTGSPLSNNLKEYWSMMNWIHPGFLGPSRIFAADYIEPIKDGLYSDSSRAQRTESQRRLLRLKGVLDGKIHRRDLTVIAADLPSKTEFVVYVSLSTLQRQLYEELINKVDWKGHRNLFKWINILRLICNHPYTLMKYIRAREAEDRNGGGKQTKLAKGQRLKEEIEESEAPSRASPIAADENEELPPVDELQWAKDVFDKMDEIGELKFTKFSNKARIVLDVVREAVKLKENILIFVHSIPTLEYLEEKLRHKKYKTYVLTGSTPMRDRQVDIDKFNRNESSVYLISCKAGSLGLNITSASRVILFDLTWNPVHDQQAVGRAYRLGQKKHVFVYRLGTFGTYEETFFTENIFKLNLSKRVIDKQNPNRFGMSKNLDLEKYFKIPKPDSDADEMDRSLFEKKDVVLDRLIHRSDEGTGPKIMELDLTETFHEDEEETYLTAEDTLAAKAEAEEEKKMREEGLYDKSRIYGSQRGPAFNFSPELTPEDRELGFDGTMYGLAAELDGMF